MHLARSLSSGSFAQQETQAKLTFRQLEKFCEQRGRQLQPPPLNPNVERLIREWFLLVSGSGSKAATSQHQHSCIAPVTHGCSVAHVLQHNCQPNSVGIYMLSNTATPTFHKCNILHTGTGTLQYHMEHPLLCTNTNEGPHATFSPPCRSMKTIPVP